MSQSSKFEDEYIYKFLLKDIGFACVFQKIVGPLQWTRSFVWRTEWTKCGFCPPGLHTTGSQHICLQSNKYNSSFSFPEISSKDYVEHVTLHPKDHKQKYLKTKFLEFSLWLSRIRTQAADQNPMRTWVWSLDSFSGLRIWHCCELWCRLQM